MNTAKINRLVHKLDLLESTARGQYQAQSYYSTEVGSEYIVTQDTIDCMIDQEWGDVLESLQTVH